MPSQDKTLTTTTSCVVCGARAFSPVITIASWSVIECKECGHGVVANAPPQQDLESLYDKVYFTTRYHSPLGPNGPAFARRIRQETHRIRFVNRFFRKGRLLDIGCGNGYFLFAARKAGLQAVGFDVTETNRHYIESELGGELLVGDVKSLPLAPDSFDVITLWHTLEHHQSPSDTIQQCLQWLKKKGVLIVEVPNHHSIDARKYGPTWPNWDLPFHLHHFSEGSLRRLLQQAGLPIIAKKTYHSEYIRERLNETVVLKPFARMIASWYRGGSLLVACRRQQ